MDISQWQNQWVQQKKAASGDKSGTTKESNKSHEEINMDKPREWQRTINGQTYLISTDGDLLPHEFVQKAFDNPAMYWATSSSEAAMKTMLDNSCTLGLYKIEGGKFSDQKTTPIGMSRMITDYVTFAYLTDVYVLEEHRGLGLAKWMIGCCKEIVEQAPHLRWMMLLTGSEQAAQLYSRELGMKVLGNDSDSGLVTMGARKRHLEAAGKGGSA